MFGASGHVDLDAWWPRPGPPPRVLVTGCEGLVGANVASWLADRAVVIGLYRARPVCLSGCETEPWDPTRPGGLAQTVRRVAPHWIVHCGPFARGSWDIPAEVPSAADEAAVCRGLIEASRRVEARLTVISTDAVFSGPRLFHEEDSPFASRHPFGRAALEVEKTLEGSGALVVRTHAFGWGPGTDEPCFAERAWLDLVEGLPCPLDPHRHATPILATDLAELVWLAFQRGLGGVCHLAGAERANAIRFAGELASLAGLATISLRVPRPTAPLDAADVPETSLDTRRSRRRLGRPMPMLREGLARFVTQARDGTRARLQGSPAPRARAEAA